MDVNDSKSNYSLILGHDVPIRIKATENYDQKKFEKGPSLLTQTHKVTSR